MWGGGPGGAPALGLAHLRGETSLPESLARRCVAALQRPLPRVELGLALRERRLASAAIDVSDGLLADLGHILERSQLAAEIYAPQLPCLPAGIGSHAELARDCQLAGGDDYELVFTAALAQRPALAALAAELELPLWRIGRLLHGEAGQLSLLDENGQPLPTPGKGYDHFG